MSRSPPATAPAAVPAASAAPPPALPLWRDPWCWLALVPVVLTAWRIRGAALCEPVLDDLLYIRHQLVLGHLNLLDGDGLPFYWRPIGRQAYFGLLGPFLTTQPRVVAAIHTVMVGAMVVLIYRALRPSWPGAWAAAAASFPVLHESAGMLIAWASNFQDLGAMLFGALAVHEASRRRLGTALAGLALSLMCKEVGVMTAFLLPFVPGVAVTRHERIRWGIGAGVVVLAWGSLYWVATHQAGVLMPKDAPGSENTFSVPWITRYLWVLGRSSADIFNISSAPQWTGIATIVFAAIGGATAILFGVSGAARARLRRAAPWVMWGAAGFLGAAATLPAIFPGWAPYRGLFACTGFGIAAGGLAAAAHPLLLAALTLARLLLLLAAPLPDPLIRPMPEGSDAVIDLRSLSRMQLVLQATREPLMHRFTALPPHSRVVRHYLPRLIDGAMKGDIALQAWFRDTTLRWVGTTEFQADTTMPVAAIIEYQPEMRPLTALVEPDAMRALTAASNRMAASDLRGALPDLDRAERLQADAGARVFLGTVVSKRAVCLSETGDADGAEREATRALAIWPGNPDSRYVLASVSAARGRVTEAAAQLDTLLAQNPNDTGALELLQKLGAGR